MKHGSNKTPTIKKKIHSQKPKNLLVILIMFKLYLFFAFFLIKENILI